MRKLGLTICKLYKYRCLREFLYPEKGHPDMFSIQGVQKLTMGATWYLGQNFMAFLETVEKRMPGIRKEFEDHMLEQSGRPAMLTEN